MVSKIFYFHPYLGKWSNLTNSTIFSNGLVQPRTIDKYGWLWTKYDEPASKDLGIQDIANWNLPSAIRFPQNPRAPKTSPLSWKRTYTTHDLLVSAFWNLNISEFRTMIIIMKRPSMFGLTQFPDIGFWGEAIIRGSSQLVQPTFPWVISYWITGPQPTAPRLGLSRPSWARMWSWRGSWRPCRNSSKRRLGKAKEKPSNALQC